MLFVTFNLSLKHKLRSEEKINSEMLVQNQEFTMKIE